MYPNDSSVCAVTGQNSQSGEMESVNVSSKELYDTVVEFARKYVKIIQSIIATVPSNISTALKADGVMLSGGGARLAGLDMFLQNELSVPVRVADFPDDVTIISMLEI